MEITPSRSRPNRRMAIVHRLARNQRNEVVQDLTAKLIVPAGYSHSVQTMSVTVLSVSPTKTKRANPEDG